MRVRVRVHSEPSPSTLLLNFIGEGFDEGLEPALEDRLCIGRRGFKGYLHAGKDVTEKDGTDVRTFHIAVSNCSRQCLPEKVPHVLVERFPATAKEAKGIDKLYDRV